MKKRNGIQKVVCAALAVLMAAACVAGCTPEDVQNVVDKLPVVCEHPALEATPAKEMTCTEDGNRAYWFCPDCRAYFLDAAGTAITAYQDLMLYSNGHKAEIMPAVAPTFTSTGLTEGLRCSVCKEVLQAQEEIPVVEPGYYAITYKDLYGAETPQINQYNERDGLAELPNVSRTGYRFVGWYTEPGGKGTFMDSIKPGTTGAQTLYAYWEIYTYTIFFHDAAENPNVETGNSRKYTVEDRIILMEPKWSGLRFVNWTDSNGTEVKEIRKGTTGDIELTANWQLLENTAVPSTGDRKLVVYYDEENGHHIFVWELGEIQNVVLKELDKKPKDEGMSISWTKSETVGMEEERSSEVSRIIAEAVSKSYEYEEANGWVIGHSDTFERGLNAKAEFKFPKIKDFLTFEVGGELKWVDTDSREDSHTTTNKEGVVTSVEETISETSTIAYKNTYSKTFETNVTVGENMPAGDYRYVYYGTMRVFAIITYDPSSGNYRMDTHSIMKEEMGETVLYVPPVGTTANIQASQGLPYDVPLDELETFMKNAYYVRYDANGGTGTMLDEYFAVDQEHTLSDNQFEKLGYTWTGWRVEGRIDAINKGETVSNLSNKGEQIAAVAQWAKNSYTIVYNDNKPSNASNTIQNMPGNAACLYDTNVTLGSAPTLTGWAFGGWYKTPECLDGDRVGSAKEVIENANLTAEAGGQITLYAKWTANSYTVTYNANGGTVTTNTETKIYDSAYGTLPKPTRLNCEFAGWYLGSTEVKTITKVTTVSDHTLVAKWTPMTKGYWHSGSREHTISTSGWTEYWNAGLNREALKALGYTEVQIELTINGYFKGGDWFKADWYFDVYDRWDVNIHQEKHSHFDRSWENRKYTFTISIDAIRDDGTIKIRYDHEGDGADDWALGTVIINTTAK